MQMFVAKVLSYYDYIVLRYGFITETECYGSGRHTQTYCHTRYSTDENAHGKQFELFQVGKRGGLKRLKKVTTRLPEGTPYVNMNPLEATVVRYDKAANEFTIKDEVLDSIIEDIPDVPFWKGPGQITDYHSISI